MKTRNVMMLAACLSIAAAALAEAPAGRKTAGKPIPIPAKDLEWTDLDPEGAPGVKVADLWGGHAKGGPFGAMLKFPAGFAAPLHTHTHDIRIVVVSGTYLQTPDGQTEMRLGPGSYLMQPGGNYRHRSGCDAASECLIFFESAGKFDLKLVEGAK
jgi:anti-sigma factor ChrR (cupin superfamily)